MKTTDINNPKVYELSLFDALRDYILNMGSQYQEYLEHRGIDIYSDKSFASFKDKLNKIDAFVCPYVFELEKETEKEEKLEKNNTDRIDFIKKNYFDFDRFSIDKEKDPYVPYWFNQRNTEREEVEHNDAYKNNEKLVLDFLKNTNLKMKQFSAWRSSVKSRMGNLRIVVVMIWIGEIVSTNLKINIHSASITQKRYMKSGANIEET